MIIDPNWLYSTIVQASAAMVAILAGFTITQNIANQAELDRANSRLRLMKPELDYLKGILIRGELRRNDDETLKCLKGALAYLSENPSANDQAIRDFVVAYVNLKGEEIDAVLLRMRECMRDAKQKNSRKTTSL